VFSFILLEGLAVITIFCFLFAILVGLDETGLATEFKVIIFSEFCFVTRLSLFFLGDDWPFIGEGSRLTAFDFELLIESNLFKTGEFDVLILFFFIRLCLLLVFIIFWLLFKEFLELDSNLEFVLMPLLGLTPLSLLFNTELLTGLDIEVDDAFDFITFPPILKILLKFYIFSSLNFKNFNFLIFI
jgi:hypothetical protein